MADYISNYTGAEIDAGIAKAKRSGDMLASVYDPAGGAKQVVFTDDSRLSDARTPTSHTHVKADVADFAHTHVKSEITDFPATMPPSAHTHVKADISDFPATMPPSSHTHVKADVTDFSHTHTVSEVTDFPATMPPAAHEHAATDITSGTLGSDRLPTVPVAKGGTGQTTAAKGLYALINGANAITTDNIVDTDYIGLSDTSAATGKKVLVSEAKKLFSPKSGNATCPAASSWTLDSTSGLYYCTVSLTGVLATHKLHLTPTIDTSDTDTGDAQQEAWDTHYYAESVVGGVKFYAKTAPTVAVTFTWEAVL